MVKENKELTPRQKKSLDKVKVSGSAKLFVSSDVFIFGHPVLFLWHGKAKGQHSPRPLEKNNRAGGGTCCSRNPDSQGSFMNETGHQEQGPGQACGDVDT